MTNIWPYIQNSCLAVLGVAVGALGVLLGLLAWFVTPDSTIEVKWLILSLIILFSIVIVLTKALHLAAKEAESISLPQVIRSYSSEQEVEETLLLLDKTKLLGQESLASVFIVDNGFERLIGIGTVATVQEDKYIQLRVKHSKGYDENWTKIRSNDSDQLKALLIKPSIPANHSEII